MDKARNIAGLVREHRFAAGALRAKTEEQTRTNDALVARIALIQEATRSHVPSARNLSFLY
jgi:hypothetical protein